MATKRQLELIPKLSEKGAKDIWEKLSNWRKYRKENLLAVFCSQDIPQSLLVQNWNRNAPEEIKDDREILIARASTKEFASWHSGYVLRSFSIPEALVGDLEVLVAVTKGCPLALQQPSIPPTLFDNDMVFQAFVDRDPLSSFIMNTERNVLDNLLARFSLRIRSNAAFIFQAAKMGLNVFPCIAGDLQDDKDFCLEVAQVSRLPNTDVPDDALEYFSDPIKADRQVVLTYVERNGCVLKDASLTLRRDLEIICAASDSKVAALLYSVGPVKKRLCRDRIFMRNILLRSSDWNQRGHHPGLYDMLSPDLKLDRELVVAARLGNSFDVSNLPQTLLRDPQFWKDALAKTCLFWPDLPDEFKNDINFARCITGFNEGDKDMIKEIVELHPDLASDTDFWCGSILSEDSELYDEVSELVNEIGSGLRNNRAVMLRACSKSNDILPELSPEFMLDREFVEVTVENSDFAIFSIPSEAQLLYPDLVAIAISKFDDDLAECIDYVNPELWSNLEVAKAWFEREGPIHDDIPARMQEDPDYCLLIIEHCGYQDMEDFVSRKLKTNKDFLLRAIEKNTMAYLLAEEGLETDYDVTLASFGGDDTEFLVEAIVDMGNDAALLYLHSFLHKVEGKLHAHDGLVKGLLCGMSAYSGVECQLPMLQQGQETALALKKHIAAYLGSPPGSEVALLRNAAAVLERVPEPDPLAFLHMGLGMGLERMFGMAMRDFLE